MVEGPYMVADGIGCRGGRGQTTGGDDGKLERARELAGLGFLMTCVQRDTKILTISKILDFGEFEPNFNGTKGVFH